MNGKIIFVLLLASVVLISGCTTATNDAMEKDAMVGDSMTGDAMDKDAMVGDAMEKDGDVTEKTGEVSEAVDSEEAPSSPTYTRYTKAKYEAAKAAGKPIFIEFYANWCPTCKTQKPVNESAFTNEALPDNAVGFFAHYNDSETNDEDRALAREFGISYQHTHVVINTNGEVHNKSTGYISEDQIVSLLNEAAV